MFYLNYYNIVYKNSIVFEIILVVLGSSMIWLCVYSNYEFVSLLISQRGNIVIDLEIVLFIAASNVKSKFMFKLKSINYSSGKIIPS